MIKAMRSKDLRAIVIFDRNNNGTREQLIRLHIEEPSKYSNKKTVYIEFPIDIRYEDYSQRDTKNSENFRVSFLEWVYPGTVSHINTFLSMIKENTDLVFVVRIQNNCEFFDNNGLFHHQLFAYVGDKTFFLSDYVGNNNSASPIQY